MLWGNTAIGSDCVVGPNTRLTNVRIADGCSIEETVGYDTVIESGATVGPRAYLRPGTHLLAGAPRCRTSPTSATPPWAPA